MTEEKPQEPAEAVHRVAQALQASVGPQTWQALAQAALDAAQPEIDRLTAVLHERHAHPDWEYATTTGPYPKGKGWVPQYQAEEGTDWRRPKSYAEAERAEVLIVVNDLCVDSQNFLLVAREAKKGMGIDSSYWGAAGGGSVDYRWRKGVRNAMGGSEGEFAARLDPDLAESLTELLTSWAELLEHGDVPLDHVGTFAAQRLAAGLASKNP
jgi:hypothetical protein